jgi:hypothetical protein
VTWDMICAYEYIRRKASDFNFLTGNTKAHDGRPPRFCTYKNASTSMTMTSFERHHALVDSVAAGK